MIASNLDILGHPEMRKVSYNILCAWVVVSQAAQLVHCQVICLMGTAEGSGPCSNSFCGGECLLVIVKVPLDWGAA